MKTCQKKKKIKNMDKIIGIISKGLGEGAYFMSMPHYKSEIKNALGFDAYPGTLNIKTQIDWNKIAIKKRSIKIKGYMDNGKTLGSAECYIAKVKNIEGAIIVPELTKHKKGVLEFIAPIHVKTKLKVSDGDEIELWLK